MITHIPGEVGQGYLGSPDPVSCRKVYCIGPRGFTPAVAPTLGLGGQAVYGGTLCVGSSLQLNVPFHKSTVTQHVWVGKLEDM